MNAGRSMQELGDSESRLRTILETASEGIVTLDCRGVIQSFNQAAADIFGYAAEEAIGNHVSILMPDDEAGCHAGYIEQHLCDHIGRVIGKRREVEGKRKDGTRFPMELVVSEFQVDGRRMFTGIVRDLTESRQQQQSLRLQSMALKSAANAIVISDSNGIIIWANHAFTRLTGYSRAEVIGQTPRMLKSGMHPPEFYQQLWQTISQGKVWQGEIVNRRKDGTLYTEEMTITPVSDDSGTITHFIAVKQDITERKKAEARQKQLQCELAHAQKLESVGQLAAGIAHEINTPTQYVGDNVRFLKDSFEELNSVLTRVGAFLADAKSGTVDRQTVAELARSLDEVDVAYLSHEIPQAIEQTLEGVGRIAKVVRAMKEFSHPGSEEKCLARIQDGIETTITVARNEWKYVADIVTDFAPDVPDILCHPGDLNQVFLNLIVNAAHAIEDALAGGGQQKGTITIRTRRVGDSVEVEVSDTGTGIPAEVQQRIFDPFFTTKEVGKGTGQGLAIARSVVVDKHDGSIECRSSEGKGATFVVRLPIDGKRFTQGADENEDASVVC